MQLTETAYNMVEVIQVFSVQTLKTRPCNTVCTNFPSLHHIAAVAWLSQEAQICKMKSILKVKVFHKVKLHYITHFLQWILPIPVLKCTHSPMNACYVSIYCIVNVLRFVRACATNSGYHACIHAIYISLQKQIGCFNHRMVTLVAD